MTRLSELFKRQLKASAEARLSGMNTFWPHRIGDGWAVLEVKAMGNRQGTCEVVDCSTKEMIGGLMTIDPRTGFIRRARAELRNKIVVGAKLRISRQEMNKYGVHYTTLDEVL